MSSRAECDGAPLNRNCNAVLTMMQRDPDYHQNLVVSSVAIVPPFHQILWNRFTGSSFCIILLTNEQTN